MPREFDPAIAADQDPGEMAIGLATLRRAGFASVNAGYDGGTLTTVPYVVTVRPSFKGDLKELIAQAKAGKITVALPGPGGLAHLSAAHLQAIAGVKIGLASEVAPRLRALMSASGLNAERDFQLVTVAGPDQVATLASGKVDALLAHTPYLETAIVEHGAVLVADTSAGVVPELTDGQIHALATTREWVARKPSLIEAVTRAIAGAQHLIHSDLKATVDDKFAMVTDVAGAAELALELEGIAAATYLTAASTLEGDDATQLAASIAVVDRQHMAILLFALGQYPVPEVFASLEESVA